MNYFNNTRESDSLRGELMEAKIKLAEKDREIERLNKQWKRLESFIIDFPGQVAQLNVTAILNKMNELK